ncbi:hypothetical protein IL992_39640 [Microbispora sp. NEAU-D428]|uniref:hypothetical protein n=1 Tax=Microbispora sitophila TaxID=2771537 RepID=UPI001868E59D|nr:hypothetical protein [Microbispora sitophila]MBE3015237.1 hypothetical protein [Microbispora sitophila]
MPGADRRPCDLSPHAGDRSSWPVAGGGEGLLAAIGLRQHRPDGCPGPPLLALGQDIGFLVGLPDDYSAADAWTAS